MRAGINIERLGSEPWFGAREAWGNRGKRIKNHPGSQRTSSGIGNKGMAKGW